MLSERLKGQIEKASAEPKARTADMLWYSGAAVSRYDWMRDEEYVLQFSMDPKHVRLDRLNNGAPLLNSHSDFRLSDVIGTIENARIENGKGYATARFSERDDVTPIWNDVQAGILQNVSMGVQIYNREDVTPKGQKMRHYLAVDWEPLEISAVPIGADPNAGFLSAGFCTRAEYLDFQRRRLGSGAADAETQRPDHRIAIQLRRARLTSLSA